MNAFGLEISEASVKLAQLKKKGQRFSIVRYRRAQIPEGIITKGEIKDKERLAEIIKSAAQQARISTPWVVLSLPSEKTYFKVLSLPPMPKEEITEAATWKMGSEIPLPSKEIYTDWQLLESSSQFTKIFLAATRKEVVESYVEVLKKAELKPLALELESAASARCLISKARENKATLIVDIGQRRTCFVIFDQKMLRFNSSIPISGDQFTDLIAQNLHLSFEEAEKFKINYKEAKGDLWRNKILKIIYPSLDKIALEVNKVIRYYQSHFPKGNEISKILLCGGSVNLFGLDSYLSLEARRHIDLANPWINISPSEIMSKKEALSFVKPLGLAMRAAEPESYVQDHHQSPSL